jgi:vancomycin resistance protein VanW
MPASLRLRVALARRAVRDALSGLRFAAARDDRAGWAHETARYALLFIDYPGQERMAEAKRHNQRLLAQALDGTVIAPGETLSLWRLAGAPTARRGYAIGAALKNGVLTSEVGGATCLLSTILYNVALLSGMEIVERRNHSVDTYGAGRYYQLGRDATIEYGYIDLRFRNSHSYPVLLTVDIEEARVIVAIRTKVAPEFTVEVDVTPPTSHRLPGGAEAMVVRTMRRMRWATGRVVHDDLGASSYRT